LGLSPVISPSLRVRRTIALRASQFFLILFHSWSFDEKLVSRFVQTPFGTADICREMADQFTREFVDVGAFEVIELLAPKVEN